MKAAIYKKSEIANVTVKEIQIPTDIMLHQNNQEDLFVLLTSLTVIIVKIFLSIFFSSSKYAPIAQKSSNFSQQKILCKVKSVGLNPVDAKQLYGDKIPSFLRPLVLWVLDGNICGIDFSGVVVSSFIGCKYKVGDEIFGITPPGTGSCAEFILVPIDCINYKPKELSFEESAVIPLVSLTAIQLIQDYKINHCRHVMIIGGSGGTGHVIIQMIKSINPLVYVSAVCSKKNENFVLNLGADDVVCYDDGGSNLKEELKRLAVKNGEFDLVIDTVFSIDKKDHKMDYKKIFLNDQKLRKLLNSTGIYVNLGGDFKYWIFAHIERYLDFNFFPLNNRLFWVRFSNCSDSLYFIISLIEEEKLKIVLNKFLPFTEEGIREGFSELLNRRVVGKIALSMGYQNIFSFNFFNNNFLLCQFLESNLM